MKRFMVQLRKDEETIVIPENSDQFVAEIGEGDVYKNEDGTFDEGELYGHIGDLASDEMHDMRLRNRESWYQHDFGELTEHEGTLIVAGFPGVGKSHFVSRTGHNCLDSDSSDFSWIEPGVRNANFPANYIEHIKANIGKVDAIFVSTHETVRQALQVAGLHYVLVYPQQDAKLEYIGRYVHRKSPQSFIDLMTENWDTFLNQLEDDKYPTHIRLGRGKTISHIEELIRPYDDNDVRMLRNQL